MENAGGTGRFLSDDSSESVNRFQSSFTLLIRLKEPNC